MDDPGIVAYSGPRSGFLREMGKLAPTEFDAWRALGKVVAREGGTIPRRYCELIALGVAFTTERPYCIEAHVKGAKTAGASGEEITEAALIAAALRAGGAASHGAMALKFYESAMTHVLGAHGQGLFWVQVAR